MIGDIISGLGSVISTGTGIYNSIEGNKFNREQFEYAKDLQNRIFDREDTAVQRKSLDLERAGFSKWLSAGGQGAASGQAVGTNLQHTPLQLGDFQQLGAMIQNFQKQRSEIGLTNAQTALTRQEALTEIEKRKEMVSRSNLNDSERQKIMKELDVMAQTIIESQSRTDLNDMMTNEKGYNLLLSNLAGRRTNDKAHKNILLELGRTLGGTIFGTRDVPKVAIPRKRY